MALTLVSANTSVAASPTAGNTAPSLTLNQAPAAGNLLVLQLSVSAQANASVTTPPSGWTLIQDANGGTTNAHVLLYWRQATGSESAISATLSTTACWRMAVAEFSNGAPSDWTLDQTTKNTSGGAPSANTGTTAATTVANEVVFAGLSKKNNDGFSGGTAGYTTIDDGTVGSVAANSISWRSAYLTVAATGTQQYTVTNAGSRPSAGAIATWSAVFSGTVITSTPSGGLVLGGSAASTTLRGYSDTPSGGIALGGSDAVTLTYTAPPSGGIVLGGSASSVTGSTGTPTGGIVFGGTVACEYTMNCGAIVPGTVDSYTVLLLHCDGSQGSTVFTDSSPSAHAMSRVQIKVDTGASVFGGASAKFNGNSGEWITTPDSSDFYLGSGDFTIDLQAYFSSISTPMNLISQWDSVTPGSFYFYWEPSNSSLYLVWYGGPGQQIMQRPWTPTLGTWYHLAAVRTGNSFKLFVNGTQLGTSYTYNFGLNDVPTPLTIGEFYNTGMPMNGYLDEIRISKGIARWTTNFTPPSDPYGSPVFQPITGGIVLNGSCVSATGANHQVNGIRANVSVAGKVGGTKLSVGGTRALVNATGKVGGTSLKIGGPRALVNAAGRPGTVSKAGTITSAPTGGIVLGGSVVQDKSYATTQSGGIVLGGSVVTVYIPPGPSYMVAPSGGIVFTAAGAGAGGNDTYTVLLLHNDGPDGSQTFIDSSAAAHPMTSGAGTPAEVSISTAHSKFGGSSAHFAFSGWAYIYTPTAADLEFGSGDWTIDFWAYHEDISTAAIYIGKYDQWNPRSWRLMWNIWAGTFTFDYTSDGINNYQILPDAPWSPTVNHDHHIALVRFGNALKFFVDGTQLGTDRPITGPIGPSGANLLVNNEDTYARYPMVGYLDELRISKGIARWTSNFTPPTAPYSAPAAGGSSVQISWVKDSVRSGGIILGGSVVSDWQHTGAYSDAPSGGIVLGGSKTVTQTLAPTPTGGVVLGGSTTSTRSFDKAPAGGIVLGGTTVQSLTSNRAPSGGIVLGGTCTSSTAISGTSTPVGGLVLGGSTTISRTLAPTPSGGIVLNGTCVSSAGGISDLFPSGGIRLGGSTLTSAVGTLTPISDLINGSWTDQLGSNLNLYAAIDEATADDADYIKSATSPPVVDICEVALSPIVDPVSSIGHTLTYRYGSNTDGYVTVTQTLTGPQADAITNYAALSVKYEAK